MNVERRLRLGGPISMLPLVALMLLTACDTAELIAPDARLPDGSVYSGGIVDGLFHGEGTQEFPSGKVYRGEFQNGYWHGEGEIESPTGWRYEGQFRQGMMSGQGRYLYPGGLYVAEFLEGQPVEGRHITDYGTYQGEFEDWDYHGEGTYAYVDEWEGAGRLSGTWEKGEFVGGEEGGTDESADAPAAQTQPEPLTETILAEDQQRLNDQINSLAQERPGKSDAYFLAVGGDGTESVFMRDIKVARNGVQTLFDVDSRAIMLLNHRDYETFPLATRPSVSTALKALDQKLNPEEDLLVVHLVSHGARDGALSFQQPGLDLPDLSPQAFAQMLEPLQARRKLIVVSACFSGQWIDSLKSSDTWIMTSSREDRTSFGCGDDSEMTWFTKAVYQSVGLSLSEPDAMFEQVTRQIRSWEEDIGMDEESWSYPQVYLGEGMRQWLSQ
ncbi:hypothetical protein E5Q11_10455 [Marinobacter confluentis]|uniref:Caspase family p20 domain-containing protein n=1 Tax=Marinobacter confluentis TaxID=1697557 RepID=A0A4Z1BTU4_9GAMM|nr:hypothetical protein E5Q11_10455 [Marinobacter confluentis]